MPYVAINTELSHRDGSDVVIVVDIHDMEDGAPTVERDQIRVALADLTGKTAVQRRALLRQALLDKRAGVPSAPFTDVSGSFDL